MATAHEVVSHSEWLDARKALLKKEKEFARARDTLAQARRDLPWEEVTKDYVFDGPHGKQSLAGLFDGRSQLIVYHFMFDPSWDAGCPHCSRWADNFNGIIVHLNQRDVALVAVSLAPYAKLAAYRRRMGWSFDWLSAGGTDFNQDFGVSFTAEQRGAQTSVYNYVAQDAGVDQREGISVFYKDADGRIFHTYSTYARGIEDLSLDYRYLDIVPRGRDEAGRGPYWVRRHDEYVQDGPAGAPTLRGE